MPNHQASNHSIHNSKRLIQPFFVRDKLFFHSKVSRQSKSWIDFKDPKKTTNYAKRRKKLKFARNQKIKISNFVVRGQFGLMVLYFNTIQCNVKKCDGNLDFKLRNIISQFVFIKSSPPPSNHRTKRKKFPCPKKKYKSKIQKKYIKKTRAIASNTSMVDSSSCKL